MTHNQAEALPIDLPALPRVDNLTVGRQGFDQGEVLRAFQAFEREVASVRARVRVLEATREAHPVAHAARMDALHLIRTAADFAEHLEIDAHTAAARHVAEARRDIVERAERIRESELELRRSREELATERAAILREARAEAHELLTDARRDAADRRREAEAQGDRLLERARHQSVELTHATRAEVQRTVEWSREHAHVIVERAKHGAEQLLIAAGHGEESVRQTVEALGAGRLNDDVVPPQEPQPPAA